MSDGRGTYGTFSQSIGVLRFVLCKAQNSTNFDLISGDRLNAVRSRSWPDLACGAAGLNVAVAVGLIYTLVGSGWGLAGGGAAFIFTASLGHWLRSVIDIVIGVLVG